MDIIVLWLERCKNGSHCVKALRCSLQLVSLEVFYCGRASQHERILHFFVKCFFHNLFQWLFRGGGKGGCEQVWVWKLSVHGSAFCRCGVVGDYRRSVWDGGRAGVCCWCGVG